MVVKKGLALGFFTNVAGSQTVNNVEMGIGGEDANTAYVAFSF